MPDWFPQVRPPYEALTEIARLTANRPDPFSAFIQNLGQSVQQSGLEAQRARNAAKLQAQQQQATNTVPVDQAKSLFKDLIPEKISMKDAQGKDVEVPFEQAFPNGINKDLLNQAVTLSWHKDMASRGFTPATQEFLDSAEGKRYKMLGYQVGEPVPIKAPTNRGDQIEVTDAMLASPEGKRLKEMGIKAGETYPTSFINAQIKPSTMTQATPEELKGVIEEVAEGKVDPSKAMKGLGSQAQKFIAAFRAAHPDKSLSDLQIQFNKRQSGETATASMVGRQGTAMSAQSKGMDAAIEAAKPLLTKLSPTQIQMIDSGLRKGLAQINDPDAIQAAALLKSAAFQYASLLKNGQTPNDVEVKTAEELFANGLSKKGLEGLQVAVDLEAVNRIGGLYSPEPSKELKGKFEEQERKKKEKATANEFDHLYKQSGLIP